MRLEGPRLGRDYADRQTEDREAALAAAAVLGDELAPGAGLRIEQRGDLAGKSGEDRPTACLPVLALQHDDEVVAADVADEVDARIAVLGEHARRQLDRLVAALVAEDIVVG